MTMTDTFGSMEKEEADAMEFKAGWIEDCSF